MERHALRRDTGIVAEDGRSGGRLARRLSDRVFHDVFPRLAAAVAVAAAPSAPLTDVRAAAPVLVSGLLFGLWVKNRAPLPCVAPTAGLPPCGLFDAWRMPLLAAVSLGDDVMADAINTLTHEQTPDGRRAIDYRALT